MIEADTTGIYGSIDYRITDDLTLIAEVRRQEDEVNDPNVNAAAGKNISPGTFESTLPRVVLKYDMSDSMMAYLNYSEGTLPGGFNPEVASKLTTAEQISTFNNDTPGITETFGEETLKNYEFGWKMTSEDGSMTANVAIFHMERSDHHRLRCYTVRYCSGDDDGDGVPIPKPVRLPLVVTAHRPKSMVLNSTWRGPQHPTDHSVWVCVYQSPHLTPETVIVVTTTMSSVPAHRVKDRSLPAIPWTGRCHLHAEHQHG